MKGFFLYKGDVFNHEEKIIVRIKGEDQEYCVYLAKDFDNILKFTEVCAEVDMEKS